MVPRKRYEKTVNITQRPLNQNELVDQAPLPPQTKAQKEIKNNKLNKGRKP